jgi:ubiquinone/menaquinone biosynthesis C-methylase UbiE
MTVWREVWEAKGVPDGLSLDHYDGFESTAVVPDRVAQALAGAVGLGRTESVLEVGCGAGMLAAELSCPYIGVDYSASLLRRHAQLVGSLLSRGEAARLPFADGAVDVVFAFSVFHYFPGLAYAHQALDEMVRVARRAVYVGDLPLTSHDPDHLCYSPAMFPDWVPTVGCYRPERFNVHRSMA